jgi:hypothetical protein
VTGTAQRAGLTLDEIKTLLSVPPAGTSGAGRLREVADRKLPKITALIERTELVRSWLESAARRECPNLNQCPLAGDPPLNAAPPQRPRSRPQASPGLSQARRSGMQANHSVRLQRNIAGQQPHT